MSVRYEDKQNRYLPSTVEFLELLGYRFELDWDNSVVITEPTVNYLHRCFGGPMHGREHQRCYPGVICFKIKRADWACYHLQMDGRALYVGNATSEEKARRLVYAKQPRKNPGDGDELPWRDSYGD